MKKIQQDSVDLAFQMGAARNVVVIKRSLKEWYFTFDADDPVTGKTETFALLTQRGQLKLWADPRTLYSFLEERLDVKHGTFVLQEDSQHETSNPQRSR
ncbi:MULTISPECIES: KorA family transcriptional regulator [Pseudomonas syringae group]|uniref:KorA family transcriptional regulator n=1 Tax=Pseudomonas syringae group TaxID=136849 RepID=UPI0006B887AD|nr:MULTISPECIES: KorA family transcriptional regulator [Pseudomonas syringae group]NAP32491.1 KorA protein [Pseudomonas syringae]